MKRPVFGIAACLVACSRSPAPRHDAAPAASAPVQSSPAEAARERAAAAKTDGLACPPGTERKGSPPPDGTYAWCELPTGERHGPWKVWPGRGTPRKIATYERGKLQGTWTQWHSEGDTLARVDGYVGDVLDGPTYRWHKSGQLAAEGAFRTGVPVGRFRAWDASGRLVHDATVDDAGNVTIVSWDEDERVEDVWRGGKHTGPRTTWYANGQKASVSELVDGSPHGAQASWYPSGKKKSEGWAEHGRDVSSKRWTEEGTLEVPMCAHGPCNRR